VNPISPATAAVAAAPPKTVTFRSRPPQAGVAAPEAAAGALEGLAGLADGLVAATLDGCPLPAAADGSVELAPAQPASSASDASAEIPAHG
jgi:hypothetical protein